MFDIEKELIKLSIENLENFELDLTEPYILKKLDSYAKKYNLSYETPELVYEEFISKNFAALLLGKDVSKQNVHEKIVFDYLTSVLDDIIILNKSDKVLSYGKMIDYDKNADKKLKTLDFYGTHGNIELFITHKYTKSKGGSQDNQFKDVCDFLSECIGHNHKSSAYVALLDGAYYEAPYRGYDSKYDFLSDRYNYWNVIVSNTNDLKDKIENLKYFKR